MEIIPRFPFFYLIFHWRMHRFFFVTTGLRSISRPYFKHLLWPRSFSLSPANVTDLNGSIVFGEGRSKTGGNRGRCTHSISVKISFKRVRFCRSTISRSYRMKYPRIRPEIHTQPLCLFVPKSWVESPVQRGKVEITNIRMEKRRAMKQG